MRSWDKLIVSGDLKEMPDEKYEVRICGARELVNPFKMAPDQTGFFQLQIDYESEKLRRVQIALVRGNVCAVQIEFGSATWLPGISSHTQI